MDSAGSVYLQYLLSKFLIRFARFGQCVFHRALSYVWPYLPNCVTLGHRIRTVGYSHIIESFNCITFFCESGVIEVKRTTLIIFTFTSSGKKSVAEWSEHKGNGWAKLCTTSRQMIFQEKNESLVTKIGKLWCIGNKSLRKICQFGGHFFLSLFRLMNDFPPN